MIFLVLVETWDVSSLGLVLFFCPYDQISDKWQRKWSFWLLVPKSSVHGLSAPWFGAHCESEHHVLHGGQEAEKRKIQKDARDVVTCILQLDPTSYCFILPNNAIIFRIHQGSEAFVCSKLSRSTCPWKCLPRHTQRNISLVPQGFRHSTK